MSCLGKFGVGSSLWCARGSLNRHWDFFIHSSKTIDRLSIQTLSESIHTIINDVNWILPNTCQPHYDATFGVHGNRLCYK